MNYFSKAGTSIGTNVKLQKALLVQWKGALRICRSSFNCPLRDPGPPRVIAREPATLAALTATSHTINQGITQGHMCYGLGLFKASEGLSRKRALQGR